MRVSARVRANRANAQRSTGPKSKQGRERSAQNAYSHGLSILAGVLPECTQAVNTYVEQLIEEGTSREMKAAAVAFAEAQVDVDRVRRARVLLYEDPNRRRMRPTFREAQQARKEKMKYLNSFWRFDKKLGVVFISRLPQPEFDERVAALTLEPKPLSLEESLGALAPSLKKLWRYERRALSRRDKAARRLQALWRADVQEA